MFKSSIFLNIASLINLSPIPSLSATNKIHVQMRQHDHNSRLIC